MNPIERLTEIFRHFPGIGERQAKRFVYYLLSRDKEALSSLSKTIESLRDTVLQCALCARMFEKKNNAGATMQNQNSETVCSICTNHDRDTELLMLVPRDQDLDVIEKSRTYKGLYFVLGGTIPLLEKNPSMRIRQDKLLKRIFEAPSDKKPTEIIIATNLNADGEFTKDYIQNLLADKARTAGISVSTLGRGLSTGTELEYSDSDTLKFALQSRIKK